MISNCGHDENGKYFCGAAGDQTGAEWEIRTWYNRPWNCVLRHPDRNVGNMLADLARKAAQNNLVGYDQNQRGTYWLHLKASNYDPAQITIKCEADCSSGVAANVKAAGYRLCIKSLQNVSADCYTGNLRAALKAAGFEVLTDSKYLTSDAYLLPGDILLYEGHHTATNLDTGSKAGSSTPSTPISGDTYTVRSGDTLSEIAAAWGVSVSDLAAYNGISNPNVINVGQVIKKPAAGTSTPPASTGNTIVRDGQIHANNFSGAGIETDGIRGANTKKAGIKVLQVALNHDYNAGLAVDGIRGAKTDAALGNHYVKYGETQYLVTAAEILLMLKGYNPNGVECPGQFGSGLKAAVGRYQKDNGLTVDYICGPATFKSLIA
nr:MAG TPA: LysM [Caudoviricetes sp.]